MGARSSCCLENKPADAFAQTLVKTPFVEADESNCDAQAPIAATESEPKVVEALAAQVEDPPTLTTQASAEDAAEMASDPEPAAEEKQLVGGCFLVYSSEENQGTLRNLWSETEVEGALAVLRPGKTVPRHKYTTNQGRSDILKQANLGVHKQRHCEGFAQFLKSSRAFDAQVIVYSDAVQVVLALKDEGVLEVSGGTRLVDARDALAICVAARDVTAFSGVRKMNLEQFAFKAQHCGGAFIKF